MQSVIAIALFGFAAVSAQTCPDAPSTITGGFKCSWGSSGADKYAKYCCDNGASATINCKAGKWDPLPNCATATGGCPPVRGTIAGGFKSGWGSTSVTYSCHNGDSYTINCANGKWDPYPTCKGFENWPAKDAPVATAPFSVPKTVPSNTNSKGGPNAPSGCLKSSTSLATLLPVSQTEAVTRHNLFRANVVPKAKTPLPALSWDNDLAAVAERWAAQCNFEHDANTARAIPGLYPSVGQNIYYSGSNGTIGNAIDAWAEEAVDFGYGKGSINGKQTGHYTQVVWDETTKVGCGIAQCNALGGVSGKAPFYFMVCNYAPAGNLNTRINFPYTKA